MSWERDLLRRYGQATEPVGPASARVKRQLLSADADPQVRALLRGLPEPAPGATERVRRRLAPRPRPALSWLVPAGALAAAAVVVFVLAQPPEAPADTVASDHSLESPAAWSATLADEHVSLTFQGSGTLHTEALAHRIDWVRGTLDIEVEPGQGEVVEVITREAAVRVVGTAFRVHKDRLGTRVEVRRGEVEVACGAEAPVSLTDDESQSCMPVDAAGMLGRIGALSDAGAAPVELLTEVERGLALTPSTPEAEELGRWQEDLLHDAVGVAVAVRDCAAALPHLRALDSLGLASDDEREWLEFCASL